MKKNNNNYKGGIPPKFNKNNRSDESSNTGGGIPRTVNRNYSRMRNFNDRKSDDNGDWAQAVDNEEKGNLALKNLSKKPPPPSRFRKPLAKTDGPVKAEVPSAPSNIPLYEGQACGGQAVSSINSQNFDFAIVPCIMRELHNMLIAKETTLARTLPYCSFQHYLNTILNAVIIKRVMTQNADTRFATEVDPYDTIHAENLYIPTPFLAYLNGFGTNLLQSGDKVYPNLPNAGIPRTRRRVANVEIGSGTFGICNTDSHNAYECYMSPYVTKKLIEQTITVFNTPNVAGAWMPLPEQLIPTDTIATPNLLGYELPERVRGETVNILQRFQFHDANTMAGRLCFSDELMNQVSGVLHERSDKFKLTRGIPIDSSVNPAAFIFTSIETEVANRQRLANTHGTTCSSEAFGASASNMANYFAYHRVRNESAPGLCLLRTDGTPIAGWEATRNNNHNMEGTFAPQYGLDYPQLRSTRFKSGSLSGTCEASLRTWLDKEFNIRT